MLSVALFSLLLPITGLAGLPAAAVLEQQEDPPVTIWLSRRNVQLGDRVRAYARTNADGYLVVLHAEPDGRVRVLFPIDPGVDNFVRGGQDLEIRSRGNREALRIYSSSGIGTVYAAFSRDPFVFVPFTRGNHWDYGLPDTWHVFEDAEVDLTDIAVTMASGSYFDYDFTHYGVGEAAAPPSQQVIHVYNSAAPSWGWGWGPSWGWGWSVGFGWAGWGVHVGLGWGYPHYGWGYPYWGYPSYYGWGYPYPYWGYPYYSWGWRHAYWGCCGSGYPGWGYPAPYGDGYPTYANRRLRYSPRVAPYNTASRMRRVYTAGHVSNPTRRLASASGGISTVRGVSSAGRRTTSPVVGAADTPGRRTVSTSTRDLSTSTRRSFPQQPVRTTPARRTDVTSGVERRSVDAVGTRSETGRRELAVGPTATRSTAGTNSDARTTTARRSITPTRSQQANPVRATDARRQVTTTRRTMQPTANRSVTTPRTSSPGVRPTTSRPSVPRTVTPAPSRRTVPTVSRPSTPSRSAPKVSRPTTTRRPTPSVSRSSGGGTKSTASRPTTRRRP